MIRDDLRRKYISALAALRGSSWLARWTVLRLARRLVGLSWWKPSVELTKQAGP